MSYLEPKGALRLVDKAKACGVSACLVAALVACSGNASANPTVPATSGNGQTINATAVPTGNNQNSQSNQNSQTSSQYHDGEFTGSPAIAARWGSVQVKAVISGGKLTDVQVLDSPHSRSLSVRINRVAMPMLVEEALQSQSGRVDIVSGATPSSEAFMDSLSDALDHARNGV